MFSFYGRSRNWMDVFWLTPLVIDVLTTVDTSIDIFTAVCKSIRRCIKNVLFPVPIYIIMMKMCSPCKFILYHQFYTFNIIANNDNSVTIAMARKTYFIRLPGNPSVVRTELGEGILDSSDESINKKYINLQIVIIPIAITLSPWKCYLVQSFFFSLFCNLSRADAICI